MSNYIGSYLVTLLHVAYLLSSARIDCREGLTTHRVDPLVVDKDLGVLHFRRAIKMTLLGSWLTHIVSEY